MAVEVGGEKRRTRLPCLATLRYMVAAVVAVLTVAVAVKMITVDLRPQDIHLSILQGHIRASDLWERSEKEIYSAGRRPMIGVGLGCGGLYDRSYYQRPGRFAGSMKRPRPFIGGDPEEDEGCDQGSLPVTIVTYGAAKSVSLRVTLRAYNPSGRVDVNCTGIVLRILDTPDYSNTTAAMEIARLELNSSFLLGPYSSHTVRRWVFVDDQSVLSYIARTYPGKSSFKAMVQVNTTVTSAVTPVRLKTTPKTVTSRCSVTVGLDEPSVAAGAVDCRPPRDVAFNPVGSVMPAPAPAPAPAVPADD